MFEFLVRNRKNVDSKGFWNLLKFNQVALESKGFLYINTDTNMETSINLYILKEKFKKNFGKKHFQTSWSQDPIRT